MGRGLPERTVSPADEEKVVGLALLDLGRLALGDRESPAGSASGDIARALVRETGVVLLDEPTSNLDIRHQMAVMGDLGLADERACGRHRLHDLNLAATYCTPARHEGRRGLRLRGPGVLTRI